MNADPIFIAGAVAAEDKSAALTFVPMDRIHRLQTEAGEQRARADAAERMCAEQSELIRDLNALCTKQARLIGEQRDELRTLKGTNATPQSGCEFHRTIIGDAEVLCEYEYEPASGDGWNEPREPATVTLIQILVNGKWCDAEDVLPAERIEKIEVEIMEAGDEAREQDKIDAHIAAREWSEA